MVGLDEVREVLLAAAPALDVVDARGGYEGIEPHRLLRPASERPDAREQIVHLVRLVRIELELGERQVEHGLVRREGIQVHGNQERVARSLRSSLVEEHVWAVRLAEADVASRVERGVPATNAVEPPEVVLDVAGTVPVSHADLVLLRILILLGSGVGRGLAELESAVDAPER